LAGLNDSPTRISLGAEDLVEEAEAEDADIIVGLVVGLLF
jgi:hypothetical protein